MQDLDCMGIGLDCFRIFGFVVMRRKRIEPSWKSARFPLVGLAARRIYQVLEGLGLTDSPCRPFLAKFLVGVLLSWDGLLLTRLLAETVRGAPRKHHPR